MLLFNRNKKQVTLIVQGQRLLEITHRKFETEQQALELLTESARCAPARCGSSPTPRTTFCTFWVPFVPRYPGVHVSLRCGNTETVINSLYSYEADIGVLGEVPTGRDFEMLKLNSTPIIAFVSSAHPLAARKSLTLKQLAQEPLVMRERGSKTRKKLEDLAAASTIELKPAIEAEGREAVREIVASGAGIGFVSAAVRS